MIGTQFDGPIELINYFAQAASMNQPQPTNHPANLPPIGLWAAMENEWATTLATQTVEVIIEPQFTAGSSNKRPERFNVRYSYGGTPQTRTNNPNYRPEIPNP